MKEEVWRELSRLNKILELFGLDSQNVIFKVEKGSIAEEMGIEPGDILININDTDVKDVFDYRYLIQDEYIEVGIKKPNGEDWVIEIEKDEYEDLGISFERGLMDNAKSCSNKCIFCFIDQLPKGMRDTLYFKDDDTRLSFLQGNYVSLTNMKEEDIERLIFYHLSPINISVHTTDMELRKFMLKNPNSKKVMEYIQRFYDAGIVMNFQIVLCKGINDGKFLEKSIWDLSRFITNGASLSVVPFGMTKFRDGLEKIQLFDKYDCCGIIDSVEKIQKELLKRFGTKFVFLSDEFYLKAERKFHNADFYENFSQLENGVGMISLMKKEFFEYLDCLKGDDKKRHISIATGSASYNFILNLTYELTKKFKYTKIDVYEIKNNFFGNTITVSGLLTGKDIIEQLSGKSLGDFLLIPENAFRADDTVMLDDICIDELEKKLECKIKAASSDGAKFIDNILF